VTIPAEDLRRSGSGENLHVSAYFVSIEVIAPLAGFVAIGHATKAFALDNKGITAAGWSRL
jgi:hypothetical protein